MSTTLATGVALGLIAIGPIWSAHGPAGAWALAAGLATAVLGGWLGTGLTVAFLDGAARDQATGILLGLAARFVATVVLIGLGLVAGVTPREIFLGAAAAGQLIILAIDTAGLARQVRRSAERNAA